MGQRIREAETQLKRPLIQHEQKDIENKVAYDYAKENNLWIDNLYSLGEPTNVGGNENTLALDKKDGVLYKANNLFNSHHSISQFLERIQDHNKLFPENKYELVGLTGHNIGGRPYVEPVVKQDYIPDATQASQQEIDDHMKSLGFEKVNDHTFKNNDYTVSDLRPRNVLKDKDGNIHVVDDIVTKNQSLVKTYLRKDGTPLDVVAKEMSDHYDVEITLHEVAQYMVDHPNGEDLIKERDTPVMKDAKDKFRELTGLELTRGLAEKIIDDENDRTIQGGSKEGSGSSLEEGTSVPFKGNRETEGSTEESGSGRGESEEPEERE